VILPQAVRRVIPPLLNDFIGLQKDTALVGTLGAIEAFKQSQIDVARRSTTRRTSRRPCSSSRSRSRSRASPTG
jgi:ABC-type amino acid transport system permease subunit